MFGVGGRARALAAMAPGLLSRLATGYGEAIVTAFDPRTREYTAKTWPCIRGRRPRSARSRWWPRLETATERCTAEAGLVAARAQGRQARPSGG